MAPGSSGGAVTLPPNRPQDFVVSGTIQLTLGLDDGPHVTHVLALNTETNAKLVVPVDPATGAFSMPLMSGDQAGQNDSAEETAFLKYIRPDQSLDRAS